MREHPLRRQVVGEMHLRRWPELTAPCTLIQWVRIVSEEDRAAEAEALQKGAGWEPGDNPRHAEGELAPGIRFAWERHSEGSSLALFIAGEDPCAFLTPRECPDLAPILTWAEDMPGEVIRASRIRIEPSVAAAEAVCASVGFDRLDLVSCPVGSSARLWSDFRLHGDGYGRLVIAANGTDPHDLSRLVKRVQDLGNYRNLALLGLPVARESWPRLNAVEAKLRALGERVSDAETSDDTLLAELSDLSLELVAVATAVNFRMSATAAYARLVEERLAELHGEAIPGYQSLEDFTQRRFLPAVRTCAALTEREHQLSLRAAQLSSLLRTRVETRIENQNARQLASMERSAAMQLRLQELVEGLSVVALSYYAVGLVSYVLKGLDGRLGHFDEPLTLAALVPVVVAGVWLLVRRLKRRLLRHD